MFEFLRRKNDPAPEPDGETKALPASTSSEPDEDSVLKGAVEAMLVDQAIPEPLLEAEPERGTVNIIGADTRIDGSLTTQAAVRLLGEIDGNVDCISLTVEAEAGVTGDVTAAQSVVVRGKIVGNLIVHGKLTITDTGVVAGVVKARSVAVDDGAKLLGRCSMSPPA